MKAKLLYFLLIVGALVFVGIFVSREKSMFSIRTDRASVIKEMKELNRLETAQFTIEKVIDGGTQQGNVFSQFLFGDRLLLIAHGVVVAGVDLSKLLGEDVRVDGDNVVMKLPAPELFSVRLDSEKSTVYDRQQGLLSRGNKDLESEVRKAAELSIKDAACSGGILTQANDSAQKQMQKLLQGLRFQGVSVEVREGRCS